MKAVMQVLKTLESCSLLRKRYTASVDTGDSSSIKLKSYRPSLTSHKEKDPETVRTRSNLVLYQNTLCIICQKPGEKVHKVWTKDIGRKMFPLS